MARLIEVTTKRIGDLVFSQTMFPRGSVNPLKVAEIAEALRVGTEIPPVRIDTENLIVDGVHRWTAHRRLYGDDGFIGAQVFEYDSEAERFAEAMLYNTRHGGNLTTYDKLLCIRRADELGISREQLPNLLNITRERIQALEITRYSLDGLPLKRTLENFAGQAMTEEQAAANRKAGGSDQVFYINQVVSLLTRDALDVGRPTVREAFVRLRQAVQAYEARLGQPV